MNEDRKSLIEYVPSLLLRVVSLVPIVATFCVSVALMIYGGFKTFKLIHEMTESGVTEKATNKHLFTAIEIVDIFLLATVVQVVSLGLYQLYYNSDISVPNWLVVRSLDELKSKLISVVITMLGIAYLGQVLIWEGATAILHLGGGIALIIVALSYFLSGMKH